MVKTISAAAFKATCLEVLDSVAETGEMVVVTKRGKPVARVMPLVNKPKQIVGALKDIVQTQGDILTPIKLPWKSLKR